MHRQLDTSSILAMAAEVAGVYTAIPSKLSAVAAYRFLRRVPGAVFWE